MPKGPPPENPSSISVDGGLTHVDIHWDAVSLKCPDLVYQVIASITYSVFVKLILSGSSHFYDEPQVLINGSVFESTKEGRDQTRKLVLLI